MAKSKTVPKLPQNPSQVISKINSVILVPSRRAENRSLSSDPFFFLVYYIEVLLWAGTGQSLNPPDRLWMRNCESLSKNGISFCFECEQSQIANTQPETPKQVRHEFD
jgi:hypothetical protein